MPIQKDLENVTIPLYNFAFDPTILEKQPISRSIRRILARKVKKIIKKGEVLKTQGVAILIDSSGFDITGLFNYKSSKYKDGRRKEFLKLHVALDLGTKQVIGIVITKGYSQDTIQFIPLLKQAFQYTDDITIVYADKAYSSRNNFEFCEQEGIFPGIKTKINYIPKSTDCYTRRKTVIIQNDNYEKWRDIILYGRRFTIESVFSSIKRMFGEKIRARIFERMITGLKIKLLLYNEYVTGTYYLG